MQISTLRGCGSKGGAEVGIRSARECRAQYSAPYRLFKVRNVFHPLCKSLVLTARGSKSSLSSQSHGGLEHGPSWLAGSLGDSKWARKREEPGGNTVPPHLLSCLTQWELLEGWFCSWLAGEVLWLVTEFVHGDRNADQELSLI